jgi:hypothetical protein
VPRAAEQQAAQVQQAAAAAAPQGGISPDLSVGLRRDLLHPSNALGTEHRRIWRAVFGIGYRFDDRTAFTRVRGARQAIG